MKQKQRVREGGKVVSDFSKDKAGDICTETKEKLHRKEGEMFVGKEEDREAMQSGRPGSKLINVPDAVGEFSLWCPPSRNENNSSNLFSNLLGKG